MTLAFRRAIDGRASGLGLPRSEDDMPDANYFFQMAGKCFRQVVLASSPAECERFERRGREFLIKAEEIEARAGAESGGFAHAHGDTPSSHR
jgi:hypothetical protein